VVSLAIVPESSLVTSVIAVVAESLVDDVTEDAPVALVVDADAPVPAVLLLLASPWSPTPPVSVSRKHAHAQRHQASQRRIAAMVASAANT
jgi:hypothetical protein